MCFSLGPDQAMDEDQHAADADHRGSAAGRLPRLHGEDGELHRGCRRPRLLPGRDPHEDAQDAHSASHHILHDFRYFRSNVRAFLFPPEVKGMKRTDK